jgi:hypothetical protein
MRIKLPILFATALGALTLATLAIAQTGVPDGLPWPRGVYIRAGSDWVGLPANPMLPMLDDLNARWLLGFGHSDAIVEMPGPHAVIQIGTTKPMFYLRGLPQANGIYLVRTEQKEDYRRIRMPVSRDFRQFTTLRAQDKVELDMRQVSGDVLSATPRSDLKAGEYAIISVFDQNERAIRAGFEFGVAPR